MATNNVAEYRGLIAALELYRDHADGAELEVLMDSKLVVEQMSGRWKIKHPDMRPLASRARDLAPAGTTYTWIPRERNQHADRLANEALDGPLGVVVGHAPVAGRRRRRGRRRGRHARGGRARRGDRPRPRRAGAHAAVGAGRADGARAGPPRRDRRHRRPGVQRLHRARPGAQRPGTRARRRDRELAGAAVRGGAHDPHLAAAPDPRDGRGAGRGGLARARPAPARSRPSSTTASSRPASGSGRG